MKKTYKFFSLIFITISIFCFSACNNTSSKSTNNNTNNLTEIALTLDNYSYYLTITSQRTGGGSAAGGTLHYSSYDVYINGAISGIYNNCSLTLKSGKVIKLNASGSAQTTKNIVNGEDNFIVVSVEGTIILY